MAGVLISPALDSKVRKRKALYKKRNESPKFRDILRERCHARIKASRCALLDKFRNIDVKEELHNTLTGILKEEVKALTSKSFYSGWLLEELPEIEEPNSEEDYWLIQEYEKILADEEAVYSFEWENQVVCPFCEMCILTEHETNNEIVCLKCCISFRQFNSLQRLKDSLDKLLQDHYETCSASAQFSLLEDPEISGIYLICESCMFFSQLV